jgi:hypothetical protein
VIDGIFFMIWQALAMYGFCHLIRPLVSEEQSTGDKSDA